MLASNIGLSFSIKRNQILIYKHGLKQLGNPAYIQLLYNPTARAFIIKSCDQHTPDYIYIGKYLINNPGASVVLYSKTLMLRICSSVGGAFDNIDYCKLEGEVLSDENALIFPLSSQTGG